MADTLLVQGLSGIIPLALFWSVAVLRVGCMQYPGFVPVLVNLGFCVVFILKARVSGP